MAFCGKCGQETVEGSTFCSKCGESLATAPSAESTQQGSLSEAPTKEDFAAFISRNEHKYLSKFKKFQTGGIDSFATTWHWPAFLVTFWWMLYRKLYLWALVSLVVAFIPGINLLAIVVWGMTGNYLYYKHAKNKITELKTASLVPGSDIKSHLAGLGGVNGWIVPVAITISIVGFLLAIIVPAYLGYQEHMGSM